MVNLAIIFLINNKSNILEKITSVMRSLTNNDDGIKINKSRVSVCKLWIQWNIIRLNYIILLMLIFSVKLMINLISKDININETIILCLL